MNLKKVVYFSALFPAVQTFLPSVLQRLAALGTYKLSSWSSKKSSTAELTSSSVRYCFPAIFFLCWGTEISEMVPNQENMEGDQNTVTDSNHCNHRLGCRSIVLVKQNSLHNFPGRFEISLSSTIFKNSWITFPVWYYLERNNTVSIRKGWIEKRFNVCQVPLLWHNSFLISLWTFQPILVLIVSVKIVVLKQG